VLHVSQIALGCHSHHNEDNVKNNNLEELAFKWQEAKKRENTANAERLAIETEMLAQMETKDEGRTAVILDNGLKIVATNKLTYKADVDALMRLAEMWPISLRPIKVKREPDETALKQIRAERPDLWRVLAAVVTVKPAKTHFSVEASSGV
jgi:hypothetical protein